MTGALFFPLLLPGLFSVHAQTPPGKTGARRARTTSTAAAYFPPAGQWQHRSPASLGLDSLKLQQAIRFARDNQAKAPRNMELAQAESFGKDPFGQGNGPFADRGDPTGIILYKGYLVCRLL